MPIYRKLASPSHQQILETTYIIHFTIFINRLFHQCHLKALL